jgi:hypothetical protein
MKKNNNAKSARGAKRGMKNKARLKRAAELREFNDLANRVKIMQKYLADKNLLPEKAGEVE